MGVPMLQHDVFQAVSDPTRRRLLVLLADGDLPIAAIADNFPISRTAVNKHLHVLNDAGLVSKRKIGRETRYKLEPTPLIEIQQWLSFFEIYWDNRLLALKNIVEQEED